MEAVNISDVKSSPSGPSGIKRRKYNSKKPLTENDMLNILLLDESCPSDDDPFEDESSDQCDRDDASSSEEEDDINGDGIRRLLQQNFVEEGEEIPQKNSTDVVWNDDSSGMRRIAFTKREELLTPPTGQTPLNYFLHILSDDLLQSIVTQTNNYAVELFLKSTGEQERMTKWKDVTKEELLKLIALLLHMGHVKMNKIQDYWKQDPLHKISVFSAAMSRNRFLLILRALRFTNNDETFSEDVLHKIRPLINHFNQRMCTIYYPGRDLILEESLVLLRGRSRFQQYISNKKHKYKLKLSMLTDRKGIVLKLGDHVGMLGNTEEKGCVNKVILHLLKEKLNAGHSVFMSNFYNSYNLAIQLLEAKTYCTGTLKLSRHVCPEQVRSAKLEIGETIGKYANGILIGKWKDANEVSYISTEFKNEMVKTTNRRNETKYKPQPVVEYNKCMSGIDRQDQMLSYSNCERRTLTSCSKVFDHILQLTMSNAYQMFNKYSEKRMSFYDFRIEVVKGLLQQPIAEKQPKDQTPTEHILSQRNVRTADGKLKRKHCKSCYDKTKRRKDTIYVCKTCTNEPGYCLECAKIIHM